MQIARCSQIDLFPPHDIRKFLFHIHHIEQIHPLPRLKLNEYVDIAFRAEIIPEYRAEKRELSYTAPSAK